MLYIYITVLLIILIFSIICSIKNRNLKKLDVKGEPLRFLFPASAEIYTFFRKIFPSSESNTRQILKRLHLKENVEDELFLFNVKKISLIILILIFSCGAGILLYITNSSDKQITRIERPGHGQGSSEYELEYYYDGEMETINLVVDELQYTEQEILDKFEMALPLIQMELLKDNSSLENVNSPLDLISSFEDITISWDIEDTTLIDYNGNVTDELVDDESFVVTLFATLSLQNVSRLYNIPVRLTAPDLTENEQLLRSLTNEIEELNSEKGSELLLPEEINGKSISFSLRNSTSTFLLPLLGLIGALVIAFGYGKFLEEKLKKRSDEMMIDFAEIVSKLSLLYQAGLSIRGAWKRIVEDEQKKRGKDMHYAYLEMKFALEKMETGMGEGEAIREFGKRCGLHPYIKLANILEQNLGKGTKGMKLLLDQEVQDAFNNRARLARKKGEEASTKMLVPMVLMLLVVIIIIAVPAMMSLGL